MFKDYYSILGIGIYASDEEIKSAYRSMSKKWHPDMNPGKDVTSIMQDINEAYCILKDPKKRARYDAEYRKFNEQRKAQTYSPSKDTSKSYGQWNYDYDIKDNDVKEDIKQARADAEKFVDDFLKSLRSTSKEAAKGAWDNAKGYIIVYATLFVVVSIIVLMVGYKPQTMEPSTSPIIASDEGPAEIVKVIPTDNFTIPKSWTKYTVANSLSISVPPTVELRHEYDKYTTLLKNHGFICNTDAIVFQQKGLSTETQDAFRHYCRILIHTYNVDVSNDGPALKSTETMKLSDEDINEYRLQLLAESLESPYKYKVLSGPIIEWVDINRTKAIEIKYRRTGEDQYTTLCAIYIFQNYDEMAQVIISYREQESKLWKKDLENVIKTFQWVSPH